MKFVKKYDKNQQYRFRKLRQMSSTFNLKFSIFDTLKTNINTIQKI
jgi:hypothetical protein